MPTGRPAAVRKYSWAFEREQPMARMTSLTPTQPDMPSGSGSDMPLSLASVAVGNSGCGPISATSTSVSNGSTLTEPAPRDGDGVSSPVDADGFITPTVPRCAASAKRPRART